MKGKGKSGTKIKVEIENDSSQSVPDFSSAVSASGAFNNLSVLQSKQLKDVTLKDLRGLQFELEDVNISTTKRKTILENNVTVLENVLAKKNKRSRSTDSVEKKASDEKHPKKVKESNTKSHSASLPHLPKSKFIQQPFSDTFVEAPKVQKNDGPHRFWNFIESYAVDITPDNIRVVEGWIKPHDNDQEYQKIPDLGEHYTLKWALDDIKDEIAEGSKSVENTKGLFTDSAEDCSEVERLRDIGHNKCLSINTTEYVSMSDRLIYSLVEENLMTAPDDNMVEACNENEIQRAKPSVSESSNTTNSNSLEKRLWKELCNCGLVDSNNTEVEVVDDDVSRELKRLQSALIPVCEYNKNQKRKLLALAKAGLVQQELKKKLQEFDGKVMELYRTVALAKKNKTMNKKLEDQIKRTLRERKKLVEKLQSSPK